MFVTDTQIAASLSPRCLNIDLVETVEIAARYLSGKVRRCFHLKTAGLTSPDLPRQHLAEKMPVMN